MIHWSCLCNKGAARLQDNLSGDFIRGGDEPKIIESVLQLSRNDDEDHLDNKMHKVERSGREREEKNGQPGIEDIVHGEMRQRLNVHRIRAIEGQ